MNKYNLDSYLKASSTEILEELEKQGKLKEFLMPLFAQFGDKPEDLSATSFSKPKGSYLYEYASCYSTPNYGTYSRKAWILTDHILVNNQYEPHFDKHHRVIESDKLREHMLNNLKGEMLEKYKKSLVSYAEISSAMVKDEVLMPLNMKEKKTDGARPEKERDR